MKLIRLIYLVVILLCTTNQRANAQKDYLYDAEKAYANKEYFSAIDNYKKAFAKASNKKKPEILFKIADLYRNFGDPKQAQTYYEKAIAAKYPDPIAILYLAEVLKKQEKYVDAITQYNEYTSIVPEDKRGEEGVKSCEVAQKWKDKPTRFKVENLQQINTPVLDYSPSFPDRKYTSLYFSSTREGATGGIKDMTIGDLFADIFETKLDKNGKWSTPVPLPEPINSKYNEAASIVTKKGNTIYFTRCTVAKNKRVPCQLYISEKQGTGWNEPVLLPFNVDSLIIGHPALTPDENTLLFSADMEGGQGGLDLWYVTFNKKDKTWGTPVNLGDKINTPRDEAFPYVHDDGSLYFASTGQIGMGGYDIFKADKKGENKWDNVTNLQYPINSAADDFGIVFEGTAKRGYLTSNREGGKGSDDIYSFVIPPYLFTMDGVVVEKDSKKPIEGATVKLVGSDGSVAELKTDKNGVYKFDTKFLTENTSYTITANGIDIKSPEAPRGYLGNPKAQFTTVGMEAGKDFKQDFELILIKQEIRMPLVLFDLNKFDLEHSSNPKDSLEYLYKILVENQNITVELAAHTDSRSPDKYNLDLSYKRAKACVDYLISKGVSGDRITPKGYGESRPLEYTANGKKVVLTEKYINTFKTVQEREALHQQNRRVVFSVLRTDYVEKNASPEEKAKVPDIKVIDENAGGAEVKPPETTEPADNKATPKMEEIPK